MLVYELRFGRVASGWRSFWGYCCKYREGRRPFRDGNGSAAKAPSPPCCTAPTSCLPVQRATAPPKSPTLFYRNPCITVVTMPFYIRFLLPRIFRFVCFCSSRTPPPALEYVTCSTYPAIVVVTVVIFIIIVGTVVVVVFLLLLHTNFFGTGNAHVF